MKKGFTLIEIVIVVSVVIVLTLLAIPNILRSRSVANEGAAMANLKILSDACQLYHANNGIFPESLNDLTTPISTPAYIDPLLAGGHKQGYAFTYARRGTGFSINANPESLLRGRYYYIDETGVMKANPDQEAGAGDEAVR